MFVTVQGLILILYSCITMVPQLLPTAICYVYVYVEVVFERGTDMFHFCLL